MNTASTIHSLAASANQPHHPAHNAGHQSVILTTVVPDNPFSVDIPLAQAAALPQYFRRRIPLNELEAFPPRKASPAPMADAPHASEVQASRRLDIFGALLPSLDYSRMNKSLYSTDLSNLVHASSLMAAVLTSKSKGDSAW
ncbi:hypothetical protein B0H17DRAFT_1135095 [Mycena rosella]|uniref:Uncharacterized protein n=1 Tax=Mycena rosella TaxID=1033263 RepID=A0AAD7DDZ1_MYCRO|nr:hypothetical protein B0H17DRAFT_1135095 [Mycena rosella]